MHVRVKSFSLQCISFVSELKNGIDQRTYNMDALSASMTVKKNENGAKEYLFEAEGGLSLSSVPNGLDSLSESDASLVFSVSAEGSGDTAGEAIKQSSISATAMVSFTRVTDAYTFSINGNIHGTLPCVAGKTVEGDVYIDLTVG